MFFFFAFLCRVCILLVFLRSLVFFVVSVLFFAFCPFPLIFVFFFRFSLFFFFLCFLHLRFFLFVSRDLSVFCTFPGSYCRLSLSLRLRGNCKNPKKREFRSDPIYTNSVRNFPSDARFSRLRPNDPSSGLTNDTREDRNDTREDRITESHRPIANKNSPIIF